jgi:peptidoglycan/LPS O-acetylase OafA/YrhL
MSSPSKRSYFTALDGLRAIAFLLVFTVHYIGMPWGWAGVDVFFVLSGFLITGILYDARFSPNRYRNFYLRRTLRIFPLYYGVFLALLLLTPVFHWAWKPLWLSWPLYLGNYLRVLPDYLTYNRLEAHGSAFASLLPNLQVSIEHFWSLCVEEQFYLIWPWVVFTLKDRRKLMWICAICVFVTPLLRWLAYETMPPLLVQQSVIYFLTPFRMDALLLGGFIALWLRGPRPETLHRLAPAVTSILLGICALGISFSLYRYHKLVQPAWAYIWGVSVLDLLGAGLVLLCMNPDNLVYRLCNIPALRWLGRISYGAYIYHDLLHDVFLKTARHLTTAHVGIVTDIIGLVVTPLVSWLSYRFFESKFIDLKERLTRSKPNPVEAAAQ